MVNTILIYKELYFFAVIPVILFLFWLVFVSLDSFVLLTVFLVPFSIPLSSLYFERLGFDLALPTELMVGVAGLLLFMKYLRGERLENGIMKHPLTLAIYFHLFWILVTTISSTMPLVSIKFLLSRALFISIFYFVAAQMFVKNKFIRRYLWAYLLSFSIIIVYVLIRHSSHGLLNQIASHAAVKPFYNDHTAYGMALGMLVPVLIGLYINYRERLGPYQSVFFLIWIGFFLVAVIFSYTRATWLSLAGAGLIWVVIKLGIRWQFLALFALTFVLLAVIFQKDILMKIESNKQTSSSKMAEHLQSMSNVRTDVSNLERLNRWNCAIRMFKERPVFGWGPGTYMFKYAPFQVSHEKTSISTNAHTRGNAHSEYLGPLSEQGIPGLLSILLLIVLSIRSGLRVYFRTGNRQAKVLALYVLLGLLTYFIHGILNNFLDSDKASALFWGFAAILVSLDLRYGKKEKTI